MNKILFLVLVSSPLVFAAAKDGFIEGDRVYSKCIYVKFSPSKWNLSQSCGSTKAPTQSLCTGMALCRFVDNRTKEVGDHYLNVACSANPNGTCPPPVECYESVDDYITGSPKLPEVQSKAEATFAAQREREYGNRGAVGATVHGTPNR